MGKSPPAPGDARVVAEIGPEPIDPVGYAHLRLTVARGGGGETSVRSAFVASTPGAPWELIFEQQ